MDTHNDSPNDGGPQNLSPKTPALFHAEEGITHTLSKSQTLCECRSVYPDVEYFQVETTPFDLRSTLHVAVILALVSPVCLNYFAFRTCLVILAGYHAFPSAVRLYYPQFMKGNIISDLRLQAGATLSLFASGTALLLEVGNSYTFCTRHTENAPGTSHQH